MVDYGSGGVGFADGQYCSVSDLKIPVFDLGFQLSDMCYDAVRIHDGKFFRLNDHLDRWEQSIAERRYDTLGYSRGQVAEILNDCVALGNLRNSVATFIATRGSPATTHKDLRTCKNRLMVWALPYYRVASASEAENGCNIVISKTVRIPPESVNPKVKNFGRLDFVRALFEAYDRGASSAVLVDLDGNITEGRGWNIFALKNGTLVTPDRGVLEGITRKTVLELTSKLNIQCKEAAVPVEQLLTADEVFLTTTAGGIIPVRQIDERILGDGSPGPVTLRLKTMYEKLLSDRKFTTDVRYRAAAVA